MINRADRRQTKEDEKLLARGIDPEKFDDPGPTAAMARQLYALLERAKKDGTIDPPISFLYSKVDATIRGLRDIPIACRKGCSHCCNIWVSATGPEVLFIAKRIRDRPGVAEVVRSAHMQTKDFSFDVRDQHPHPCPLLSDDLCSIYDIRPVACRLAASANAEICARSYLNITNEDIPAPLMHLSARALSNARFTF